MSNVTEFIRSDTLLLILASPVYLKAEHGAASCASTPVIDTVKKKKKFKLLPLHAMNHSTVTDRLLMLFCVFNKPSVEITSEK